MRIAAPHRAAVGETGGPVRPSPSASRATSGWLRTAQQQGPPGADSPAPSLPENGVRSQHGLEPEVSGREFCSHSDHWPGHAAQLRLTAVKQGQEASHPPPATACAAKAAATISTTEYPGRPLTAKAPLNRFRSNPKESYGVCWKGDNPRPEWGQGERRPYQQRPISLGSGNWRRRSASSGTTPLARRRACFPCDKADRLAPLRPGNGVLVDSRKANGVSPRRPWDTSGEPDVFRPNCNRSA